MCKVQDVADFFIDSALSDPDDNMTNLRVNKLLYFAQGWSLARNGRPLFDDDFFAWDYGPVVPAVYKRLKVAGRSKIQDVDNDRYDENFTADEKQLLIDVLRKYADYSTSGLVKMSHQSNGPWSKAHSVAPSSVIEKNDIQAYFKTLPPLPSFSMPELSEDDFVGYRDAETGNYVLPEKWFNE